MSEADISVRTNDGAAGMPVPGVPEAYTPQASAAAPSVVPSTARLYSVLRLMFSFPAMLGTFLVGRVFYEARTFFVDPDLWWHIKTGENILATHHWPTTDPYSFTVAGQPWIATEWLGDVLLATAARFSGVVGLQALLIVLSSVVVLALYAFATLRSGNSKAGFASSAVLCSLAFASFTLRPQMLGYLFLILTLIALERFRRGQYRAAWFLPALFLVWINAHGSWVIGLGTIFMYWMSGLMAFRLGSLEIKPWTATERKSISLVFLLCLAVLPLTPYGTRPAAYPFEVASQLPIGVSNVAEWQSMPFNLVDGRLFLGLLLGFIVLQVIFRFTWRLEELALFLFGTMMACLHMRFLLLFVPFSAGLFAAMMAGWMPPYDRKKDHFVLNAILMSGVAFAMVYYYPSRQNIERHVSQQFPTGTVKYLRQHHIGGPLLNNYRFGGYLVWAGQRVFVDGRSDPYERGGALSDYLYVTRLKPGTMNVLKAYGIQACLLEPDEPLATFLAASPEWERVASDEVAALFVRKSAAASPETGHREPPLSEKE